MFTVIMQLSPLALDHVKRPRLCSPIEFGSFGVAGVSGDGPYVENWADLKQGVFNDAGFQVSISPSSTETISVLCEIAIGREATRTMSLTNAGLFSNVGASCPR